MFRPAAMVLDAVLPRMNAFGRIAVCGMIAGYDGALSIEHEDGLMSAREGFEKAVSFLRAIVIKEDPGHPFWA